MSNPLIIFNPKLPKLSKSERQVLDILVEAGKLIAPVYLEQERQVGKVSRTEIENAGKKDRLILSPYTVVEKENGKLTVTPYHVKYAKLLKPVAEKLEEAATITENKEFGRVLHLQAKALMDGSYEQAIAARLKIKPYILDITIAPVDHADYQLFSGKATYQAWVGTLDVEGTERLNNYKTIVLSVSRAASIPVERVDSHNKVKAKTIDVVLFSGFMARTKFVGVNLPMDVNFVEKYGSEITIFNQPNDLRMQEQILPTFNKIFPKEFKEEFSLEDLRRASLRYVAMHELAHSFLYYRHAKENLQDLFQTIYELAATILGLRMAGSLLLQDRITSKQLESMIVVYICRSLHLIEKGKTNKPMITYVLGSAIFINFMLESRALKELKGMEVPNFMKIFVVLHDLSNILERLLSSGTRKDAEVFIKKYSKQ